MALTECDDCKRLVREVPTARGQLVVEAESDYARGTVHIRCGFGRVLRGRELEDARKTRAAGTGLARVHAETCPGKPRVTK